MSQLCIQIRDSQSWWRSEKKESLMFIIKSLNITMKRRLSHALMISVLINVSERMHKAHCFIDFEIERNFILQSWVKEHKLLKNHATLKQIQIQMIVEFFAMIYIRSILSWSITKKFARAETLSFMLWICKNMIWFLIIYD